METGQEQKRKFEGAEELPGEESVVVDEESQVYTFTLPAKRGYYYAAVEASSPREAIDRTIEIAGRLREVTGRPRGLSVLDSIDNLVIGPGFKSRFREFGCAHKFVPKRLPPFHERTGYRSSLPE